MILAAVDDLLFTSKISAAARQLGVEIRFARTQEAIAEQARADRPSLIIFDLNSRRLDPLAAIAALKADAPLAAIRTLGFVSHVDAETIAGARRAGIDDVLARSAFVDRLAEILRSAERSS